MLLQTQICSMRSQRANCPYSCGNACFSQAYLWQIAKSICCPPLNVAHSVAPVRGTPRLGIHLSALLPVACQRVTRLTNLPVRCLLIAAQFCIVGTDGTRAFSLYHTLPVGSGALDAGAFVPLVDAPALSQTHGLIRTVGVQSVAEDDLRVQGCGRDEHRPRTARYTR